MANKTSSYFDIFNSTSYPPTWNWKEDSQPRVCDTPEEYIQLANDLKRPSLTYIAQLLAKADFIHPQDIRETVNQLCRLENNDSLDFGGVKVCWRVKSVEAAKDKLTKDKDKEACDIGDYFGAKLIAHDVKDIVKLRNAILDSKNMTSRKCEFTEPSVRGFRSHKSHHDIKNFSIEVMITHEEFEKIEKLTHHMMEQERELLRLSKIEKNPNLLTAFNQQSMNSKETRTALNLLMARNAGLDELCSPNTLDRLYSSISPIAIRSAADTLSHRGDSSTHWPALLADNSMQKASVLTRSLH